MGIGTLIIFIAIILVAAVASMVLIQTSGSLQQRALTTGKQTEGTISTGAKVTSVTAVDANNSYIDSMELVMKLRSGSDPIKFEYALLTQETQYASQDMVYGGTGTGANTSQYEVEYIQEGKEHLPGYLGHGDVVRISYPIMRVSGPINGLGEEERVEIYFVPRTGHNTYVSFITPDILNKERIRMYP